MNANKVIVHVVKRDRVHPLTVLCENFAGGYNPVMARNIFSAVTITAFLLLLGGAASAAPQTMRLDYYHTGDAKQEVFSVDRVVIEPLPWPGDLNKTIDDTNLGKYFFEVRDEKSKRVLYSRGFASIYGEWETTDEARSIMRTFSESLRFPAPDAPVEVTWRAMAT